LAYGNRSIAHFTKGEYDQAIADYDKSITYNPSGAAAYWLRGESLLEIGEKQRAMSDLEKALELGLSTQLQERVEELLDGLSQ